MNVNLTPASQQYHTVHSIANWLRLLNPLWSSMSVFPLGYESLFRNSRAPSALRVPFPSYYPLPSPFTSIPSAEYRISSASSSIPSVSTVSPYSLASSISSSSSSDLPDSSSIILCTSFSIRL